MKQFYFLLTLAFVLFFSTAFAQNAPAIAAGDTVKYVAYLSLPIAPGASIVKAQLAIGKDEVLTSEVTNALLFKAKTAAAYTLVAANTGKSNIEEAKDANVQAVINITGLVPASGYVRDNGGAMSNASLLPATYNIVLPRGLSKTINKWWLLVELTKPGASPASKQFIVPFYLSH